MCELLGGEILGVLRRDQLRELPNGSVSNKRGGDELQRLPNGYVSRYHRCLDAGELWSLHGGELLWRDWPHGCQCCVRYWDVLCGISYGVF